VTDTGNGGVRKIAQIISSSWTVLAIGGALLTAIAWGVTLRNTVERNQETVLKQAVQIDELKLQLHGLQSVIGASVPAREVIEAMRAGVERNRVQDERIIELLHRIERLEQKQPQQ
jgi:hypothetical protein